MNNVGQHLLSGMLAVPILLLEIKLKPFMQVVYQDWLQQCYFNLVCSLHM